jgi:excisionase family DNA binding protein
MLNKLLTISEAASFLSLSKDTLRRLDKTGLLKAERLDDAKHRRYRQETLEAYLVSKSIDYVKEWLKSKKPSLPKQIFYCPDSSVFQGKLYKFSTDLESLNSLNIDLPLLIASVGEIGDNSFGHNIGNWPDISGLFFVYNLKSRFIILADRGRGVLNTLRKIRPSIENDEEALKIAFTEIISGRAPESRGNGLKFVKSNVEKFNWTLCFQSKNAEAHIGANNNFLIKKAKEPISGCLAILRF